MKAWFVSDQESLTESIQDTVAAAHRRQPNVWWRGKCLCGGGRHGAVAVTVNVIEMFVAKNGRGAGWKVPSSHGCYPTPNYSYFFLSNLCWLLISNLVRSLPTL